MDEAAINAAVEVGKIAAYRELELYLAETVARTHAMFRDLTWEIGRAGKLGHRLAAGIEAFGREVVMAQRGERW